MQKNTLFFGAVLLALSLLAACGAKGRVLKGEDNGTRIQCAVGEKFSVTLASNPTTGYQWDVAEADESVLKLLRTEYTADRPRMIGSGGMETFTFEVVGRGETTLTLVYHQPWEKYEPSQTFTVQVVADQSP